MLQAFRSISMCTHPDRLRGRLKRQATAAEACLDIGFFVFIEAQINVIGMQVILRNYKGIMETHTHKYIYIYIYKCSGQGD